jgi:glyceraldehyde 3-phosphate dehydrogenase
MSRKIAINGFGRIGRMVFRLIEADPELEVVAINDLTSNDMLAHLVKYDSVHGTFPGEITADDEFLYVDGRAIRATAQPDPTKADWSAVGAELVMECTGRFRTRDTAAQHITAGAEFVIVSAPAKGEDLTVVMGVNDEQLDPSKHKVVSNGSCTTNCLAPVVKVIDDAFGIEHGLMTTIHAYTNDQRILDFPHSDKRRARAAAMSMIPTTTGAAVAVGKVLPHLNGKLDGMAVRVPTPNVSLVDVVFTTTKPVTAEAANAALKAASEGAMKGVLDFETKPLVSIDYNGNPFSSSVDALSTKTLGTNMLKVLSWYDNEWGFSNRMIDLSRRLLGL